MLSGGPRRFGELRRDIPKISPKMLTARLRALEDKGVVIREVMPSSPPSVEYTLSELGEELIPVIDAIVKVGTRLRESQPKRRAAAKP
jgi:DNA-binding HxlR family transcriptional regulator